jgi:hypothetical protein
MCKELIEELERGRKAMQALVEHLIAINADSTEQNIAVGNYIANIKVKIKAKWD